MSFLLQVTWDEWLLIRKTPLERNLAIAGNVRKAVVNSTACGDCSDWYFLEHKPWFGLE